MRARIHGLFVFAKITGLVLGIQMMTGIDISETGILTTVIESLASNFGELNPLVLVITTIGIPIATHKSIFII
ncbi:MAG: hypothetical protein IH841_08190 [Thaumarchaeota archaeon]|nr:hypothetical protein [Nitrososphaerota archaeon]